MVLYVDFNKLYQLNFLDLVDIRVLVTDFLQCWSHNYFTHQVFCIAYRVPFNYNFIFTCMENHDMTPYFACNLLNSFVKILFHIWDMTLLRDVSLS